MNRNPYIAPLSFAESIFQKKKMLWDAINRVVHKKKIGLIHHDWADDTFIPMHTWMDLFNYDLEQKLASDFTLDLNFADNKIALLASLMSISSWRYSQGCYQLNEAIYDQAVRLKDGALISPKHIENMHEWSVCIPLRNVVLEGRQVHNLFIHKNYSASIPNPTQAPNTLIFTFNIEPHPEDRRLIEKDRNFKPMPYVILTTDCLSSIANSINGIGHFPFYFNSIDEVADFMAPYVSIFNTIFDPLTQIESEYIGVKKPHYKDIQQHVNFNEFNIPTVKYLAPSNTKTWQVGHNLYAKLKQRQRRDNSTELPLLKWDIQDQELLLIT